MASFFHGCKSILASPCQVKSDETPQPLILPYNLSIHGSASCNHSERRLSVLSSPGAIKADLKIAEINFGIQLCFANSKDTIEGMSPIEDAICAGEIDNLRLEPRIDIADLAPVRWISILGKNNTYRELL